MYFRLSVSKIRYRDYYFKHLINSLNKLLTSLFIVAFGFGIQGVVAQSTFATIIKNVNVRAKGVKHSLNATKDTLLLESDKKINYVYAINRDYKKELYDFIDDNSYKVPLSHLKSGKYTFVVGQSPLKIVFAVYVYRNEDKSNSNTPILKAYSTL